MHYTGSSMFYVKYLVDFIIFVIQKSIEQFSTHWGILPSNGCYSPVEYVFKVTCYFQVELNIFVCSFFGVFKLCSIHSSGQQSDLTLPFSHYFSELIMKFVTITLVNPAVLGGHLLSQYFHDSFLWSDRNSWCVLHSSVSDQIWDSAC